MPRRAMPCHAGPCCAVPCHAGPRAAVRRLPCHAVQCRALPCRAEPFPRSAVRRLPCQAVPCRAEPCRASPSSAERRLPCQAVHMPCRAVPCRAVPVPTLGDAPAAHAVRAAQAARATRAVAAVRARRCAARRVCACSRRCALPLLSPPMPIPPPTVQAANAPTRMPRAVTSTSQPSTTPSAVQALPAKPCCSTLTGHRCQPAPRRRSARLASRAHENRLCEIRIAGRSAPTTNAASRLPATMPTTAQPAAITPLAVKRSSGAARVIPPKVNQPSRRSSRQTNGKTYTRTASCGLPS